MKSKTKRKSESKNELIDLSGHGAPTTRREFIARGLAAGGSLLFMPSLLSMVSRHSFADDGLILSGDVPAFVCIDLAGGANLLGSNFMVGGPGGQRDLLDLSGYQNLGLPTNGIGTAITSGALEAGLTTAGKYRAPVAGSPLNSELGILFHPDSAILEGIKRTVGTGANSPLNNVDGIVFCTTSQDDSGNNPFNPSYWIASSVEAGAASSVLKDGATPTPLLLGRSRNANGSENPRFAPAVVRTPNDARSLANVTELGVVHSNFSEVQSKTFRLIRRLSEGAFTRFSQLGLSDQLKVTTGAVYEKLAEGALSADQFDPTLDPMISAFMNEQITAGGTTQTRRQRLDQADGRGNTLANRFESVAKLLVDGYARAATFTLSGYDYHAQNAALCKNLDLKAGVLIGSLIELFKRKQKPLVVYIYTDGGVDGVLGGTGVGGNGNLFRGDNGTNGGSALLVYNPVRTRGAGGDGLLHLAGRNEDAVRQIGNYTKRSAGAQVTSAVTANSVNAIAQIVFANYLALKEPDERRVREIVRMKTGVDPIPTGVSSAFPQGEFRRYVPFKTLLG